MVRTVSGTKVVMMNCLKCNSVIAIDENLVEEEMEVRVKYIENDNKFMITRTVKCPLCGNRLTITEGSTC